MVSRDSSSEHLKEEVLATFGELSPASLIGVCSGHAKLAAGVVSKFIKTVCKDLLAGIQSIVLRCGILRVAQPREN